MNRLAQLLEFHNVILHGCEYQGKLIFRLSTKDNSIYTTIDIDPTVTDMNEWVDNYLLPAIEVIEITRMKNPEVSRI